MENFLSKLFFGFLCLSFAACTRQPGWDGLKSKWKMTLATSPELKIDSHTSVHESDDVAFSTAGGLQGHLERVASPSAASAQSYLNDRLNGILRRYDTRPEPYQGTVTRTIECLPEYKPVRLASDDGAHPRRLFKLYASSRMIFGACTADAIAYQVYLAALYCPGSAHLIWMEVAEPAKSPGTAARALAESMGCD